MVCYKVCAMVEDKEKLLNLKLDGLQKHVAKKKTLNSSSKIFGGWLLRQQWQPTPKKWKGS